MKTFTVDVRKWAAYPKKYELSFESGLYTEDDKRSCCLGFVVAQQLGITRSQLADCQMPSDLFSNDHFDEKSDDFVERFKTFKRFNFKKLDFIKQKFLKKVNDWEGDHYNDQKTILDMANINDEALCFNDELTSDIIFNKITRLKKLALKAGFKFKFTLDGKTITKAKQLDKFVAHIKR